MKDILRLIRNFCFSNQSRKIQSLIILKNICLPDYRLCWPQMDWWTNRYFNRYLRSVGELPDGLNTHRKWMLLQLLRMISGVEGDTAECGVYKGASSWLICDFKRKNNIAGKHYLFDSFQGLSVPTENDGKFWREGALTAGESEVIDNLNEFLDMVELMPGWIPNKFAEVSSRSFSFVHVDVDLEKPTKDSIDFFYPRLNIGGIFLCDDYGFDTCPGATKVIDEFLQSKPEKMIHLDNGGGFFIKGKKVFNNLS